MLEHLFGSKTRVKLLRFLFRHEFEAFYVRELARLLETQMNAIRREISILAVAGLLLETDAPGEVADDNGPGAQKRKYYRLNVHSPLFPELQSLMMKARVLEEQVFVEELKTKIGDVKVLMLAGRFTGAMQAQTDMLIVGAIKERVLSEMIGRYEKDLGFDIRYTVLTEKEFWDRRHVMDKFIYTLFEGKHVMVMNTLNVR
jgi:hypothetical protein